MPSGPQEPCSGCGVLRWRAKGSAAVILCHQCRAERRAARGLVVRIRPERVCEQCGGTFRPTSGNVTRTCSLSCGQRLRWDEGRTPWGGRKTAEEKAPAVLDRWQRKNRRRRALKRGARSEHYTLAEVAERDGYLCGICRVAVPMGIKCPHSAAPTVDHIVPIVAGGDDTLANVQLAHFVCNSRKGARVIEQVA